MPTVFMADVRIIFYIARFFGTITKLDDVNSRHGNE